MAGPVRHPIDTAALERYLGEHVPEIKPPLDVKQFGFGQSNPTYQLTCRDGHRYVLRKKPAGALLDPAAHKVEREYRVIAALGASTETPVPRAYCLCEDAAVLGTAFYIMSFVDGRMIDNPAMPSATSATERTALWRAAVTTLARLHRVDHHAAGLSSYGRAGRFYDRQLATWRHISEAQARVPDVATGQPVGRIPHLDDMSAFFADRVRQPRDRATLIHGDYKIDNLVFHPTEARVVGILDWEMSTVGHPLSDLANLANPFYTYTLTQGPASFSSSAFVPGATPGLPTPDQIMGWYAETAGWDPRPEMTWAMAFSQFRGSAICQGIAARVARGQASSEKAKQYTDAWKPLAEFAWTLVRKETEKDREEKETTARGGSAAAKL